MIAAYVASIIECFLRASLLLASDRVEVGEGLVDVVSRQENLLAGYPHCDVIPRLARYV